MTRTTSRLVVGALAAALLGAGPALCAAADEAKVKVTFVGHAAFEVVSPSGTTLLIDPFITRNPKVPAELKDLSRYQPTAILVTHSHGDHVGDMMAIAQASGAKVVGASDHVGPLELKPGQGVRGNPGGKVQIGDVTVYWVPAVHGSAPGGRPVGFVLKFSDGRTLYHTGDTDIFGDMALIQELYRPNIILLQAGGGPFNQQPEVAALAVRKYFTPDVVVPMHYGTFGVLAGEDEVRAAFAGMSNVRFMQPGESAEF